MGYQLLGPTEPIGILILLIGFFFTGMILFIFYNVNQNSDSIADQKAKEFAKLKQEEKIASLYPKKKRQ